MKTKLWLMTLLIGMISFAGISKTTTDPAKNSTICFEQTIDVAACDVSMNIASLDLSVDYHAILNPEIEPITAFSPKNSVIPSYNEQPKSLYSVKIFRPGNWRQVRQ